MGQFDVPLGDIPVSGFDLLVNDIVALMGTDLGTGGGSSFGFGTGGGSSFGSLGRHDTSPLN
jgi:hypothetical protein